MAKQRYVSHFDLPSLILTVGFCIGIDVLNFFTFFLPGIVFTIVLMLLFSLMKVSNVVTGKFLIGFASTTVYVLAVYFAEKAKELSPILAEADGLASSASKLKPPSV